ncbi:hypothetical protein BVRB_2g037860 [Beta vulgaris subsp. vulgaris]|nr:hypothetical protein BVRB_2g037860 [Beta vulgaris subsp. vulgaris]
MLNASTTYRLNSRRGHSYSSLFYCNLQVARRSRYTIYSPSELAERRSFHETSVDEGEEVEERNRGRPKKRENIEKSEAEVGW